jgi:hypothetical protein
MLRKGLKGHIQSMHSKIKIQFDTAGICRTINDHCEMIPIDSEIILFSFSAFKFEQPPHLYLLVPSTNKLCGEAKRSTVKGSREN